MEWLSLGITVLAAFVASGVAIWQVRTQRVRQFEDVYVARYWSLLDRLSLPALRGVDGRGEGGADADRDTAAIRLYFRLSEDEADLRAQGWVSDETWGDWGGAIHAQMHRPPFDRVWAETLQDSDAGRDYGFVHLRRLWHDAAYDPPPTRPLRALLRRSPWRRRAANGSSPTVT
ncbi:hypothetical protein SAMN06272735_6637 [Streptomyces sp. TLI_55]|uniref:hypothetical protein n=1 Tax=Streptomyces sp. TLI_55 TaxID=1938861 RepID=UPI000BC3769D|nr:hypothetical protein [Streptomyces sp. TLI_55]SNX64809.1 hypothetical protein SAMN06272735_6637 [Streptomyces sp. TLI_55]